MNESQKLYLRRLQKEMNLALTKGTIKDPVAQQNYVNNKVKELLLIQDDTITASVKTYFNEQDVIEEEIKKMEKELQKKMDEYVDNVKDIYEQIKKL